MTFPLKIILQHHAEVYDVRILCPAVDGLLPSFGQGCVIGALLLEDPCKIRDPFRLGELLTREIQRDEEFKPAMLAPSEELDRAVLQKAVIAFEESVNDLGDPLVLRQLVEIVAGLSRYIDHFCRGTQQISVGGVGRNRLIVISGDFLPAAPQIAELITVIGEVQGFSFGVLKYFRQFPADISRLFGLNIYFQNF